MSLHWAYQNGVPLSTKSTSDTHLSEDLVAVSDEWSLTPADMATLDKATTPSGSYSFACKE